MLKIGVTFIITLAVARAEPPVSSYLPSRTGIPGANSAGSQADLRSAQYGAPDFGNSGGINRNDGATSFDRSRGNAGNAGPSKLYGAPIGENAGNGGNGVGGSRGNGFGGGQLSGSYNAPSNGDGRPSSIYGVPGAGGNKGIGFEAGGDAGRALTSYDVPNENNVDGFGRGNNGRRPSTSYGVPDTNDGNNAAGFGNGDSGRGPSTGYGAPDVNRNARPSDSYDVPGASNFANGNANSKNRFNGGSGSGSGASSSGYGSPGAENAPGTSGISRFDGAGEGLSSSYGPPNRNRKGNNNGYTSGSPSENSGSNGYPSGGPNGNAGNYGNERGSFRDGGGAGYNDNAQEESTGPTKYEFSYEVKDARSGSEYGHTETREGDRAQGEYNILLPDGRKQIVEYEADQDGFKPQIRYEGEANTGGYSSGAPNGNDGYPSGRPNSERGGFANNSGFNGGREGNSHNPNGGRAEGKHDGFSDGGGSGYQSGRPEGRFFGRDNDSGLSGDIGGGYFSNPLSNNIDDTFKGGNDNVDVASNRQNGGNGGYQY